MDSAKKISVNGVRLFVEVLGPKLKVDAPRSVELPTVLALHGGPSDHAHMIPMVAALRNVAQVVMYDHRGCGRSESGDPALWRQMHLQHGSATRTPQQQTASIHDLP